MLLKEYLLSGDISEAEHCLKDLEVPHFHHELVYEVRLHFIPEHPQLSLLHHGDQISAYWEIQSFFFKNTKIMYKFI